MNDPSLFVTFLIKVGACDVHSHMVFVTVNHGSSIAACFGVYGVITNVRLSPKRLLWNSCYRIPYIVLVYASLHTLVHSEFLQEGVRGCYLQLTTKS